MLAFDLAKVCAKAVGFFYHRLRFASFGRGSFIIRPLRIVNSRYIHIGANVRIRDHFRVEALDKLRVPSLVIGDDCNIEQDVHIICSGRIEIGHSCSLTARCSIVDTEHPVDGFQDSKIGERINLYPKQVLIGPNCFIGIGAVILPNVVLGRNTVVGANSVVTAGTYPPFSVLAGAPARVIRSVKTNEEMPG